LLANEKTSALAERRDSGASNRIHALDILRLQSLVAVDNFEGNRVSLIQGFESRADDARVMHEDVLAGILGDEPKPFSIVKPLHFAAGHKQLLISGML
jgi:hypothetical protein